MGSSAARGICIGCTIFIGIGSFISGIVLWVLGARAVRAIDRYNGAVGDWSPNGYTRFLEWATGSSMTPASTNALSNLAATITPDAASSFTVASTRNATLTYTYGLPDPISFSVASGVDLTPYPLTERLYTSWVNDPSVANSSSFGPITKPFYSYDVFGMSWLNIYLNGIEVGHMPIWLAQQTKYYLSACQSSSSSSSGSIISAASCLAARSACNSIGDFGFSRGTCTINVRLSSVCVALPDSLLRSAAAAGPSWSSIYLDPVTYGCSPWYESFCSPQYGQTCYSAPRYTVNPRNNFNGAADFSGVPVEVRSADDPYVVAVQATNGQMKFSDGPAMLIAGKVLTPIGIVFFGIPFTAILLWVIFSLMGCGKACEGVFRRRRRYGGNTTYTSSSFTSGAPQLRVGTSNSFGNTTTTPAVHDYGAPRSSGGLGSGGSNRQSFRDRGREVSRSLRFLAESAGFVSGSGPVSGVGGGKNQKGDKSAVVTNNAAAAARAAGPTDLSATAAPTYPPVAAYPPVSTIAVTVELPAASAPPADDLPGQAL